MGRERDFGAAKIMEYVCVDSRCSYGRHEQVPKHRWDLREHTCDPWPNWAEVDVQAVAVEALYRWSGGWAGPRTIRALMELCEEMGSSANPASVVAEFARRKRCEEAE